MQAPDTELGWLLTLQMLQSRHDALYCSNVVRMSPTHRAHHLVTQMAKFIFHIQSSAYTRLVQDTIDKRVTDLIVTTMSLLTALNVDMSEMLKKLCSEATDEYTLMQWLTENYVYALSDEISMRASQIYDRGLEYTTALPIYMHQMVDAVSSMVMMNREMKPKAVLTNAAMHIWIQCIICHSKHGYKSFTESIRERLNEVELKNIHSTSYGLYPNYQIVKLV